MCGGASRSSDARQSVLQVYNSLQPKPDELLDHSGRRQYVREGKVQLWSVKEKKMKPR